MLLLATFVVCFDRAASAQPAAAPPAEATGNKYPEALPLQATDPTAYLLQIQTQFEYEPSQWRTIGSLEVLTFKPVIPFTLLGLKNLLRLTLPYDISTPQHESGQAAVQLVNLVVFDYPWGRWGAGFDTNSEPLGPGDQRFQLGPAGGIVGRSGRWMYGFLGQNYLGPNSYKSWLQPILACHVAEAIALSLGDMQIIYDWKKGLFTQVPVGLQLDLTPKLFGQPIHLFANALYNPQNYPGSYIWRVVLGFASLVPGG
jgi:hypothetical protein